MVVVYCSQRCIFPRCKTLGTEADGNGWAVDIGVKEDVRNASGFGSSQLYRTAVDREGLGVLHTLGWLAFDGDRHEREKINALKLSKPGGYYENVSSMESRGIF